MKIQKTTSKVQEWNLNLRNRVGDPVTYMGETYVNISGKNSEPPNAQDWVKIIDPDRSAFIDEAGEILLSPEKKAIRLDSIEAIQDQKINSDIKIQVTKPKDLKGGQWANIGLVDETTNPEFSQAFIELFGNSKANWNSNPLGNVIIGKCEEVDNPYGDDVPVISFCAIENEDTYTAVTSLKRVLYNWTNGYIDNTSLMQLTSEVFNIFTSLYLKGQFIDNSGNSGSDGDVLTKVNGQVIWQTPS